MAVIYLFDAQKQLKKPVKDVVEIIHREGEYEAEAQITAAQKPEYGDFFGFWCADRLFRMFLVTRRETSDETGICTIAGPDAALQELESSVLAGRLTLNEKTLETAAGEIIQGTDWQIGQIAPETQNKLYLEDAYYSTRWAALKKTAAAAKVRAVPYYEFAAGRIVGRKVDLISKAPVFRGLIINRRQGARNILITEEGTPYRRVFALGKIISSSEPPEQVTIANAVWSTANGDPVDKPAGQDYIEIPGAAGGEYVFEDKQEEDTARLAQKAYDDLLSKQQAKAAGIANISDTEYMPGYKHKAMRMYDLAVVRTEQGDTVATTVINIERYHVQEHLTKIEVGEEKESDLDAQIARLKVQEADTARRAGGARAGAKEAKEMVLEAEEKITLNSKAIELRALAADVAEFENQTITRFTEIGAQFDAVGKQLTLYAKQTDVNNIGNTVNALSAQVTLQADQISQKVSAGEIASAINQTAQSVLIDAGKIDLRGYVTADALETTTLKVLEEARIPELKALEFNCSGLGTINTLYVGEGAVIPSMNYAGTVLGHAELTMGDIVTASILNNGTGIDLQHSHSVSVADDGTITFGEVSSSGGSFKVADTKAYKDGVSAAKNTGYANGKADWSPVSIERTDYNTTDKTVTVRALNAAGVPVLALETIDVTEIYEAGYNDGYNAGYNAGAGSGNNEAYYNTGWNDALETVKVGHDAPTKITHLGDNVYQMTLKIWATAKNLSGNTYQVQATTIYPSKGIYS